MLSRLFVISRHPRSHSSRMIEILLSPPQEVGHISTVRWKHKCISTSTFLWTTPRGKTESQSLASNSQIPSSISYPVSEFWNNKCCWSVPVVWHGHILCEVNGCPKRRVPSAEFVWLACLQESLVDPWLLTFDAACIGIWYEYTRCPIPASSVS